MRREYDFTGGTRGKHVGKRLRIVGDVSKQKLPADANSSDTIRRLLRTKHITVSWVYEGTEGYIYKSVPGTVVSSEETQSLRFELAEKNGDDENFEVIIRKRNGSFILKADHPEMKSREYPLKEYLAPDELVFYLQDENNRAYFHLGC